MSNSFDIVIHIFFFHIRICISYHIFFIHIHINKLWSTFCFVQTILRLNQFQRDRTLKSKQFRWISISSSDRKRNTICRKSKRLNLECLQVSSSSPAVAFSYARQWRRVKTTNEEPIYYSVQENRHGKGLCVASSPKEKLIHIGYSKLAKKNWWF